MTFVPTQSTKKISLLNVTFLCLMIGHSPLYAMDDDSDDEGMSLMSLFGGGKGSSTSLFTILKQENPKNREKLLMDNYNNTNSFIRRNGDNTSIVTFSVSTIVPKKGESSSPFYPTLEVFSTTDSIISVFQTEFKRVLMPLEAAVARPTRLEYHAYQLGGEIVNDKGKRPLSSAYSGSECIEMSASKRKAIDKDFDHSEAFYNALHMKDFDISVIFSYANKSRELKLNLKTDNTPELIAKIPPFSEQVPQKPNVFFGNLGQWFETTLTDESNRILKKFGIQTGMHQ